MTTKKYTSTNVPREVVQGLYDLIEEHDLECADNFRFTPIDDAQGQDDYEDLRESGCCGSFDREYVDHSGKRWKIGCNYGH